MAGKLLVWSLAPVFRFDSGMFNWFDWELLFCCPFIFLCCGKLGISFGSHARKKNQFVITLIGQFYLYYIITKLKLFFRNFTLYTAYSRIDRGNLVLRHSVLHFHIVKFDIACFVAELNVVFCRTWSMKFKY